MVPVSNEPEPKMHPLISIHELDKLTDLELAFLEARLREIILTRELCDADLTRCAATLSNAVYVRTLRRSFVESSRQSTPH